jgi:hypothetical protein
MKTAKVTKCNVCDCAYNIHELCHAMAITIGYAENPTCDTFCKFMMKAKAAVSDGIATVGACKVSSCIYNVGLECQAPEIIVAYKQKQPKCLTFQTNSIAEMKGGEVSSRKRDADSQCPTPEIFVG